MTNQKLPGILHRPVDRLLGLVRSSRARRTVIGLVGLPGSGKSTLAGRLADEVNVQAGAGTVVVLGMDGFHLTRAALSRFPDPAAALARRGAPWTFDPAALATRLHTLHEAALDADEASVTWPGFEHDVGDPVENSVIVGPAARLVLLEGLYLLHRSDGWNLAGLLDECWYLDVTMDVALQRLTARHMAVWGLSPTEAEARIAVNDRLNADIVLQGRARADWLVAG